MRAHISICIIVFGFFVNQLYAQAPSNDNCENADEVIVADNGFGFGVFNSGKHNVEFATKQRGEKCAAEIEDNGNCDKTVWFKFYIPTTRNISIQLTQQDSAIPQIFAGFNVYSIQNCNYSLADLEKGITPINKFGHSGNTCLNQGWYLIQIACKQKAKGELWVAISSQLQQSTDYDNISNLYDFGLVVDRYLYKSFNTNCAAVSKEEALVINDSSLSKSIFCSYTLPVNSFYNEIVFNSPFKKLKYRIFKDGITIDSVNSSKAFIEVKGPSSNTILNSFCKNLSTSSERFVIQFVCGESTDPFIYLQINNHTFQNDLWNTPNTDDIIQTNNSYTRTKDHKYNCSGLLKNHACKNVIPEFFTHNYSNYSPDTFDMAGYTVINSTEEGIFNVVMKNVQNYNSIVYYAVYEGDITQGCNLNLLKSDYTNEFSFCIGIGKYTLVTAVPKLGSFYLGKQVIKQYNLPLNISHYEPNIAENLGTYTPSVNSVKNGSVINFKQSNEITLTVDTFKIHGYFIYREFYLAEKAEFRIDEMNFNGPRYYLFKGQISNQAISLLDKYSYTRYNNSYSLQNCSQLDIGWYTIIDWLDTSKKEDFCMPPTSEIRMRAYSKCTRDTTNFPASAIKINGLADVLSSVPNKLNLDYVYNLPLCIDCDAPFASPALLNFKKQFLYPSSRFSYFVFYLAQDAEFRINGSDNAFELYKGNSISNPAIVQDTNNIVSTCNYGNIYCNLKGGKFYTLVVFNVYYNELKAFFTPHKVSPNDYAINSYDLGHFSANVTRTAAPMPITCHTNASKLDPCAYENANKVCPFNYNYYPSLNIPWKDTIDIKRQASRKNLWYTFTVDKPSDITLTLTGATPLYRVRMYSVYKYTGPYEQDFSIMKSQGFDSTETVMKWLATNSRIYTTYETRDISVDFTNQGCGKNRYFVIIEDDFYYQDPARYEYILKVQYTEKTYPIIGDFCNDPASTTITSYGTSNVTANNTCHTYGNSPNEEVNTGDIKSTWFKISISNIYKCDLSIRQRSGSGLKYYTVYGGTCGSLTKITHVTDANAYLTLSCMGSGDYYIQAVYDKSKNSNASFEVIAKQAENPNCKPYDFDSPIAQYMLTGGCNNDTLHFKNISTFGQDIRYSWFINYTQFSSLSEPLLSIKNPLVKTGQNFIKLVVFNSAKNTIDSIIQIYQPDTNNYYFKVVGPSIVSCLDTFELKVNTNFPHKINYQWISPQVSEIEQSKSILLKNVQSNRTYFVRGESDNCIFNDTFSFNYNQNIDLFKDTMICDKENSIKFSTKKSVWFFLNGVRLNADSFTITKPGKYELYYNYGGCPIEESLEVDLDSTRSTLYFNDTLQICNKDIFEYEYTKSTIKNAVWNTGDSGTTISIAQDGLNQLKGKLNSCRSVEHNLKVEFIKRNINFMKDTMICLNDTFHFNQTLNGYNLVEKNPSQDIIIGKQDFKIKMKMDDGFCTIEDSANVDVIQTDSEFEDVLFCDSSSSSFILLDAGIADAYNWIGLNEFNQLLNVNKYDKYMVERTYKTFCKDTSFFNVMENCPFEIFIPNIFTPNGDLNNDVFKPVVSGRYLRLEMVIFNRWGQIIHESDINGWNGFFMGELVMEGVYGYYVKVIDANGKEYLLRGSFTLIY